MAGPEAEPGPFDPEGLSTVHEVPYPKTSYDIDGPFEQRLPLNGRPGSRDPDINSSFARSYREDMAADPPPVPYTTTTRKTQHARRLSDGKLRKADRRNTVGTQLPAASPAHNRRLGGLRNTIRRVFGRKSMKERTSMPTGTIYPHQDPEGFITSASDIETTGRKVERSASLPANTHVRSSGLSSHPPFQPPAMPPQSEPPAQPPLPYERPQRPRRSSIPSNTFTREDLQAVTDAMSGIGLHTSPEQSVDARNIGFAVTNGSNPKRRSRSVGAVRDSDHRMSPIQWRRLRRKSEEFLHYTESRGFFRKVGTEEEVGQEEVVADAAERSQNGDFNFELQDTGLQELEHISLEERLVALEIKLMNFEYTLSKLQAGSAPFSQPTTKREHNRPGSVGTHKSTEGPSMPTNGSSERMQAGSQASFTKDSGDDALLSYANRPTSVATTLKPGQNPQGNSFWESSTENGKRFSLSGLTIEHYGTLVTLVRHEQSARMRLEEQVSQLQQQLERSLAFNGLASSHFDSGSNHRRDISSSSQLSRRLGSITDDGRRRAKYYFETRPRTSSYSTNETDTEDDFHDTYVTPTNVTPVERGEYERGAFNRLPGVEDGEAF